MKIFEFLETEMPSHTAVALGTFNGLHIGHRKVIQNCVDYARRLHMASAVVSIRRGGKLLVDGKRFEQTLEKMGVDNLIYLDIEDIRDMSATDFFEQFLEKKLWLGAVFCGYNYRFGKDALGDTRLITALCMRKGIYFNLCPPVLYDGEPVSTTEIKRCLTDGNIETAIAMMGQEPSFSGTVKHGNAIGRTLNAPTANFLPQEDLFVPRRGVYFARVTVDGERFNALCNIGCHPTVGESEQQQIECFLLDCNRDLYSKEITVNLLRFHRAEQKFENIEQLNTAIEYDKSAAFKFFD